MDEPIHGRASKKVLAVLLSLLLAIAFLPGVQASASDASASQAAQAAVDGKEQSMREDASQDAPQPPVENSTENGGTVDPIEGDGSLEDPAVDDVPAIASEEQSDETEAELLADPVATIDPAGSMLFVLSSDTFRIGQDGEPAIYDENTVISSSSPLSIVVEPGVSAAFHSVRASSAPVFISGTGSISFDETAGSNQGNSVAIECRSLDIEDATVSARGTLYGIWSYGSVSCTNATLNAEDAGAVLGFGIRSIGIMSKGDMSFENSTVTARGFGGTQAGGGDYYGFGGGIYAEGSIVQVGGTVQGNAGNGSAAGISRAGIYASGAISVSAGGVMEGDGWIDPGHLQAYSRGICAGELNVTDATVRGLGGDDWNAGLYITDEGGGSGNLTAVRSTVYAEGCSIALYVFQKLTAIDSQVSGYQPKYFEVNEWTNSTGVAGVYVGKYPGRTTGTSIATLEVSGSTVLSGTGDGPTYGVAAGTVTLDGPARIEGTGVINGINFGTINQTGGEMEGVATSARASAGISLRSGSIVDATVKGTVTSGSYYQNGSAGVRIYDGEIVTSGSTIEASVPDDLSGVAYGIKMEKDTAVLNVSSGTVTGTALSAIGIGGDGTLKLSGTAEARPTVEGHGGYAGVHVGGPLSVVYGTLYGESGDEPADDPETRAGIYSASGGIDITASTVTGVTKQLYSTTSGAINANGAGVSVRPDAGTDAAAIEHYLTPYQTVKNDQWYTPFAGSSLTVGDGEFPTYEWTGEGAVEIDANEGVKSTASEGTAQLTAVRDSAEGNKQAMQLGIPGSSHTVHFGVLLETVEPVVSYTVTFDPNNGSFVDEEAAGAISRTAGGQVTSADAERHAVTRPGYEFAGWTVGAEGEVHDFAASAFEVTGDTVFVAQWTPLNVGYMVHYVLDGTEGLDEPTYVAPSVEMDALYPHGTIIDAVPDPENLHEKYRFSSCNLPYTLVWHDGASPLIAVAASADLRALADQPNTVVMLYEIRTFTISYVDPDGNEIGTEEVPYGEDGTPPVPPSREGEEFDGWDGDYTNVTSDRIIVATYTPDPADPTVPAVTDTPTNDGGQTTKASSTAPRSATQLNARTGDDSVLPIAIALIAGAGLAVVIASAVRARSKR